MKVAITRVNATLETQFDYYVEECEETPAFRTLQSQFGRCVSKMYRDLTDGSTIQVGYVFRKKAEYSDRKRRSRPDYYIEETWVEFLDNPKKEG